jgi:nitrogen regulatory protein P-II 2
MKYVIAIIQPDRLEDVMAQLEAKDVNLLTVSDVMGRGRQKGVAEVYRSHVERGGLLRKTKIEIAVNDSFLAATIEAITTGAHSNNVGDGKIFIFDLEECVRIRTGERGGIAIG